MRSVKRVDLMNVLIACECSGIVRDAFIARGHNAVSCDFKPTERPGPHYQGDVRDLLEDTGIECDLMIAFPDCTYLTSSGLHWNHRVPGRAKKTDDALDFVRYLLSRPIPKIALENPQGCIGTRIRPASQYIQPYDFGDDASKRTGLWLKNLPLLVPDPRDRVRGRWVRQNGKDVERWANQTDSGQNRLAPSAHRAADRAVTYPGIASAMAATWG